MPVSAALGFAGDGHVETGQVHLPLLCCPTGFMVWAPCGHTLPGVLCKTHCPADIPKVANNCPVFPGWVCGFTLFALPACGSQLGGASAPAGSLVGCWGGLPAPVPSLQWDRDAGEAADSLQPQSFSGAGQCQQQPMDQYLALP